MLTCGRSKDRLHTVAGFRDGVRAVAGRGVVMTRGSGLAGIRFFAAGCVSLGRRLGRDMDVKRVVVCIERAAGGGDRRPVERMGDPMPGL